MSDILIVGGGIIGMLTARELVLAGMRVTVVDKSAAGQESSWAGGGIISPLYPWRYSDAVTNLARWGQAYYPELIDEINAETGLDAELTQSGLLIFDDEAETAIAWANQHQYNLQHIDNKQVYDIEPRLSANGFEKEQAIWMPDIRQVRNPRLVKVLKKYLLKQGVKFVEHSEVTGLTQDKNKIRGVQTDSGELCADKVLVASGAWSAKLLNNIDINIDVEPVKGQMILFKTDQDKIKRIVLSRDRYVIPRRDGRVLVGSTLEHTEFDKSTTHAANKDLIQEAVRIMPCLEKAKVEHHWAGLRPGSKEGIPYICEVASLEGLYLNSGHYRNGIALGPASARLASDLILQRSPILTPEAYGIDFV